MDATGSVSLLVKSAGPPSALSLGLGAAAISFKPLMPSIDASLAAKGRGLGAAPGGTAQWYQVNVGNWQGSVWDACHEVAMRSGLGAAGSNVHFVEPDLHQQWPYASPRERDPALAADSSKPAEQNKDYPRIPGDNDWYRDDAHGQFRAALAALGANPPVVRVAHLDTGYDAKACF